MYLSTLNPASKAFLAWLNWCSGTLRSSMLGMGRDLCFRPAWHRSLKSRPASPRAHFNRPSLVKNLSTAFRLKARLTSFPEMLTSTTSGCSTCFLNSSGSRFSMSPNRQESWPQDWRWQNHINQIVSEKTCGWVWNCWQRWSSGIARSHLQKNTSNQQVADQLACNGGGCSHKQFQQFGTLKTLRTAWSPGKAGRNIIYYFVYYQVISWYSIILYWIYIRIIILETLHIRLYSLEMILGRSWRHYNTVQKQPLLPTRSNWNWFRGINESFHKAKYLLNLLRGWSNGPVSQRRLAFQHWLSHSCRPSSGSCRFSQRSTRSGTCLHTRTRHAGWQGWRFSVVYDVYNYIHGSWLGHKSHH